MDYVNVQFLETSLEYGHAPTCLPCVRLCAVRFAALVITAIVRAQPQAERSALGVDTKVLKFSWPARTRRDDVGFLGFGLNQLNGGHGIRPSAGAERVEFGLSIRANLLGGTAEYFLQEFDHGPCALLLGLRFDHSQNASAVTSATPDRKLAASLS